MSPLLSLDDPRCTRTDVAGAKAARLATAAAAGLTVLPGVVVPAARAAPAIAAGVRALADRGLGAARRAVLAYQPDAVLAEALAGFVERLGEPAIVRSSVDVEGEGWWAGAFGTLGDIGRHDVSKALASCWASLFKPDTIARLISQGRSPDDVRFAILLQPQIEPIAGGTARLDAHGVAHVAAVAGSPAPLLAGWASGVQARITMDGAVTGRPRNAEVSEEILVAADRLVRTVAARLGDDVIEWAWRPEGIVLLQTHAAAAARGLDGVDRSTGFPSGGLAVSVARTVQCFGRGIADELVLPWALAERSYDWSDAKESAPLPLVDARARARELTARVWHAPPGRALAVAAATLRRLRGDEWRPALERIKQLRPVRSEHIPALIATARHGASPPAPRTPPTRWEPFVFRTVAASGARLYGSPAAPGIGAGTVEVVTDPDRTPRAGERVVVVSAHPLPALAPRLWHAAGLVTATGSPGAHLFEVARSLGVPAVIVDGVAPWTRKAPPPGSLAAVDGDEGTLTWTGMDVPTATTRGAA